MSILPTASNKQIHFEVAFRYDAQHVGEIAFFRASVVKGERVSRKKGMREKQSGGVGALLGCFDGGGV